MQGRSGPAVYNVDLLVDVSYLDFALGGLWSWRLLSERLAGHGLVWVVVDALVWFGSCFVVYTFVVP